MHHLYTSELLDLLEERPTVTSAMRLHLGKCKHCADKARYVGSLIDASMPANLDDADVLDVEPQSFSSRCVECVEVMAPLLFDSRTAPAAIGLRGPVEARHLVFSATEFDVHLRIAPESDGGNIFGQVLKRSEHGFPERCDALLEYDPQGGIKRCPGSKFGEFSFDGPIREPVAITICLSDIATEMTIHCSVPLKLKESKV